MPSELVHFLRDGLFADFASDLVGDFLRKNFFRIHLDQNHINLREDNRYENRIITENSLSEFNSFPLFEEQHIVFLAEVFEPLLK